MLKQTFVKLQRSFFSKVSNHRNSIHEKWNNTKLLFFFLKNYNKKCSKCRFIKFYYAQIPKISN